MPSQVITDDLSVCTDCVVFIANGELPSDTSDERYNEIVEGQAELQANYKYLGLGEDAGFSTYSCDCCGSPLHGDRTHLTYVQD